MSPSGHDMPCQIAVVDVFNKARAFPVSSRRPDTSVSLLAPDLCRFQRYAMADFAML